MGNPIDDVRVSLDSSIWGSRICEELETFSLSYTYISMEYLKVSLLIPA